MVSTVSIVQSAGEMFKIRQPQLLVPRREKLQHQMRRKNVFFTPERRQEDAESQSRLTIKHPAGESPDQLGIGGFAEQRHGAVDGGVARDAGFSILDLLKTQLLPDFESLARAARSVAKTAHGMVKGLGLETGEGGVKRKRMSWGEEGKELLGLHLDAQLEDDQVDELQTR